MSRLLYIEASPRKDRSASIEVARIFRAEYQQIHPKDVIETLDLWHTPLPEFDGEVINSKYAIRHGLKHTEAQRHAWSAVEKIISHFTSADKYVFSLPMGNFGVPYKLKHYIDVITQPGYTFSFTPGEGYKVADINISYFAIGTTLGDIGSIGFDLKSFDFGDIPVTTENFPDGTGETYSPSFLTIGFSYSKVLTDRISIGTNLKLISENIQNTNATGFALDACVQYRVSEALMIGAAVKNIGSDMNYTGQDLADRTGIPGSIPGSSSGATRLLVKVSRFPASSS